MQNPSNKKTLIILSILARDECFVSFLKKTPLDSDTLKNCVFTSTKAKIRISYVMAEGLVGHLRQVECYAELYCCCVCMPVCVCFHIMGSAKDLISHALSNRWVVQWCVMREHAVRERESKRQRKRDEKRNHDNVSKI